MCLITVVPKKIKVNLTEAMVGWDNNPDGGGIAYVEGGKIVIQKTLKREDWEKRVKRLIACPPESDLLLHTRIATHGMVSLDNVHPFRCADWVVAHNGIFNEFTPRVIKGEFSDSRLFVRALERSGVWWREKPGLEFLATLVSRGNKLAFLTREGIAKILNPSEWVKTSEGIYYSNSGYRASVIPWRGGLTAFDNYARDEDDNWGYGYGFCDACQKPITDKNLREFGYCRECLSTWTEPGFCAWCGGPTKRKSDVICHECFEWQDHKEVD
jgi:glutamine amidotransferase